MNDLRVRAVRGGFARVCGQVVNFSLRTGSLMILARLLKPGDFGLVAMATAVTGVFSLFKDFGLSAAAIQRTSVTREQMSALFWINLLVGAVLTCLTVTAAPFIASFYHEPRLFWVTVALGGGFLISAGGVQHAALLKRQMRFTSLVVIDTSCLLVSVAVGIWMALFSFGYWALVGMTLVTSLAYTVSVWLAASWVPGFPHREVGVRSMMQFGSTITLNGIVVYIAYNLEKVLLGRFWGANAVGIYERAFQLVNVSTENLNSAIGEVAFSALSRIKDDGNRLKSYFLKGYSLIVALTCPLTIGCALFADDLIVVVLGPNWSEVIQIFRLLTPIVLVYSMINPLAWLLFSTGLVRRSLKIALVLAPLVMMGYLLGLPYGPTGVALGYSIVMVLWVIPHLAWCVHGTLISLKEILRAASRPLLSTICAGVLARGLVFAYLESLSPLARLFVGMLVFLIAYVGTLFYVMRQKAFYVEIVRTLTKALPTRDC